MRESSPTAEVSKVHIRTHDGNDAVWTPGYDDYDKVNESGIAKPIWGFGGEGNDFISGGDLADKIYGGAGDDRELLGRKGDDYIWGGEGDDIIEAHAGDDHVYGGGGDDRVEGWGGADTIYGDYDPSKPAGQNEGDDIILGGMDESFTGVTPDGADTIYGGGGDDRIDAYKAADWIRGGEGNDEIWGGDGADKIWGGDGYDNLFGQAGMDAYLDYYALEDFVYDDEDNDWKDVVPLIDLVTDCDDNQYIDPVPASEDNRRENGFYGGRKIDEGTLVEMQIHLDYTESTFEFEGKQLRLDWTGDGDVIEVYLDPEGTSQIHPGYTWPIPDPYNPDPLVSIYVKGLTAEEYASLTLTLLDEYGEPVSGRPIQDFVLVKVVL